MTILNPAPLMQPETWDRIATSSPAETRQLLRDFSAGQPPFHLTPEGYNPWLHAARTAVPIKYADTYAIVEGALGLCCWDREGRALVMIHPDVDYPQERATLTHELIHAAIGPQTGCPPEVEQKIEAAIDQIAALRLVPNHAAALWQVRQIGASRAADLLHIDLPQMEAFLEVATEKGLFSAGTAAA